MSDIPSDLRYTEEHDWICDNSDGTYTVGITDYAQAALGDLVFVELPTVGDSFDTGDECAVLESVKAASDLFCPISGKIIEVNEELEDIPETINTDPYDTGWIFKIQADSIDEFDNLLNSQRYTEICED